MMCSTLIMKSRALVILGLLVVGTHCEPSQSFKLKVGRLEHLHKDVLASPHDNLKFLRFCDHVLEIEVDKEFVLLSENDKMVVRKARKTVDDTQDMNMRIAAAGAKMNIALVGLFILCCGLNQLANRIQNSTMKSRAFYNQYNASEDQPYHDPAAELVGQLCGVVCCAWMIVLFARVFLNFLWVMF
eukprot:202602_1